jgi:UDP-galactopyranose mutase
MMLKSRDPRHEAQPADVAIRPPVTLGRGAVEVARERPRGRGCTILCLSHLRWNFVFQRPQHLLTRAAREHRVLYVEEPIIGDREHLEMRVDRSGVHVIVPHLVETSAPGAMGRLLDELLATHKDRDLVLWYYTPMALPFTEHLRPVATVYDCMDELSAFAGAAAGLQEAERRLLARADLVLTGGHSLYLAKKELHHNVHEFPSGVDVQHFATARLPVAEPEDQRSIPGPRIGFFGVLDERLDCELLAETATRTPGWQYILIGPVAKIDPSTLPRRPNLHYLGPKAYADLPRYIAGWDVAMMPFARNEATRFISPTKTPEYLAAGKPVVSTAIPDVVRGFGDQQLARIANTADDFVEAIRESLCEPAAPRCARADACLSTLSWDGMWMRISERLRAAMISRYLAAERSASAEAPRPGSQGVSAWSMSS